MALFLSFYGWISNMDGSTDCHSDVSLTEKDRHRMVSLTCVIGKKNLYKWTYLQNRNRITDVEINITGTGEKEERDKFGDLD